MTKRKEVARVSRATTITGVWAREGRAMCDELAREAAERAKAKPSKRGAKP